MFNNVTGLIPGTTVDRCIDVTYTGIGRPDGGAALRHPARRPARSAPYLNLTIDDRRGHRRTPSALHRLHLRRRTLYTGTLAGFAAANDRLRHRC